MPQATNLVVKDSSNVDKTFTLLAPAAGNGGIAEWALKEGSIATVFSRFTAMAAPNANRARVAKLKLRLPSSYTDTVTSLTNVGPAVEFNVSVTVPDGFPEAKKDDCVAYFSNLMNHALVKGIIRDAVAAT